MKMDVQSSSIRVDVVDEGDLIASMEDLSAPPRLRGELSLEAEHVTGWLVDARAPKLPLNVSLTFEGKRLKATIEPYFARRNGKILPSTFRLPVSSPQSGIGSGIRLVTLEVTCFDGEAYELVIEPDANADQPVNPKREKGKRRQSISGELEPARAVATLVPGADGANAVSELTISTVPESARAAGTRDDQKGAAALVEAEPRAAARGADLATIVLLEKKIAPGESTPVPASTFPDADAQIKLVEIEFDRAYYLTMHPDVESAGIDPLEHYFYTGWREGRNPNGQFDTNYYISVSPEISSDGPNPFWHFLAIGRAEGRLPSPPQVASQAMPEVSQNASTELEIIGMEFDSSYYLATYPDVGKAGVDPLLHFFYTGWREGRNPNDDFDTSYYLSVNVDVHDADLNPFWHYLVSGRFEGRLPRRPGGYKRTVIDRATPAGLKAPADLDPEEQESKPASLGPALKKLRKSTRGVVVSLSHDCYIKVIGGTQIFISDEQKRFNDQNFTYIHVSPQLSLLSLASENAKFLVRIVADGQYLGLYSLEALISYLDDESVTDVIEKYLVVHCVLGFHVPDIVRLQKALSPVRNFYWLHDYSSLCEGFNLLRNDVEFCGAPATESLACRVCVYGETRREHERQFRTLFEQCQFEVLSPSQFTLDLWKRASKLPFRSAKAHPHWKLVRETAAPATLAKGAPLSIAYLGYPSSNKGWPLFCQIVRNVGSDPRYRFFHLAARNVATLPKVEFIQTEVNSADRTAAISALATNQIRILLLLSPWPETFSFVAHEAIAAGASIFCLRDSGNVASLVEQQGVGKVFTHVDDIVEFLTSGAVAFVGKQLAKNVSFKIENAGTTATALNRSEVGR
jgi:hypothetical protein